MAPGSRTTRAGPVSARLDAERAPARADAVTPSKPSTILAGVLTTCYPPDSGQRTGGVRGEGVGLRAYLGIAATQWPSRRSLTGLRADADRTFTRLRIRGSGQCRAGEGGGAGSVRIGVHLVHLMAR